MKKQGTALYILKLALTLLIITAVVAAALAVVNAVTAPKIARLNEEKTQAAIEKVLPGGGEKLEIADGNGMVRAVYGSDKGYAVEVASSGFGGEILMMVGIDLQGSVTGLDIISHTETAGLGSVAAEDTAKGEAFRNQFAGTQGDLAVEKDGGQIDSLTSATITSRAVVAGVNAAVECVKNLG